MEPNTAFSFNAVFANLGLSTLGLLILVLLALLFSSYVKIVTVLSILRAGIGANSIPAVFVTTGLALALSLTVMFPTIRDSARAMDSVLKDASSPPSPQVQAQALDKGLGVWQGFLNTHASEGEKQRFASIAARLDKVAEPSAVENYKQSWRILAPAFLVTELQNAFATGISIFLPFLVIDLLIAGILAAVGMTEMNPSFVSLPFKLFLFVMVDGWGLIAGNLLLTYQG